MTARGVLNAIQTETGSPGPGEVLFKVAYASIILLDVWRIDLECFVTEYPAGIGYGASGTVVEVGPGVESLSVGDRVSVHKFKSISLRPTYCRLLRQHLNLNGEQCKSTVSCHKAFVPR
jgi:NADPH:quinone reductase-like Zn-dependent oxidoreductase